VAAAVPSAQRAAPPRRLNAIKRQQFPRMLFVPKSVPQQAIKNCGEVFERFFNFGESTCTRPRHGALTTHPSCRTVNPAAAAASHCRWSALMKGIRVCNRPANSCADAMWIASSVRTA
jgi:hypothetical protein